MSDRRRKWRASASVVASTHIGEFEAATAEEAERLAAREAHVSVCCKCSHSINNPEIDEISLEPVCVECETNIATDEEAEAFFPRACAANLHCPDCCDCDGEVRDV